MWNTLSRGSALLLALIVAIAVAPTASAQHHGGHHGGGGHVGGGHHGGGGHVGGGHHGGGGHIGGGHHSGGVHIGVGHLGGGHLGGGHHSSWQHYVPSMHDHHIGAYYSYGGANYYSPVARPVQVYRPVIASSNVLPQIASAPLPAEPNPIAPQSVKLEFGGFQRTEDLAERLEIEANRWCLDMHYNYQHNSGFAATYREAYRLLQLAKSMHAADHTRDRENISRQAAQFENAFHEVQDKIKPWSREERRAVGEGGINGKAEIVESILHHLLFDVGVKMEHGAAREEQAPAPAEDITPPAANPAP